MKSILKFKSRGPMGLGGKVELKVTLKGDPKLVEDVAVAVREAVTKYRPRCKEE